MVSITRKVTSARSDRRAYARDRLLHAMEKLLSEGATFMEISLDQLVAAAGVARTTFYVYFQDKGDLMCSWVDVVSRQLRGSAECWLTLDESAEVGDLRDALAAIAEAYRPHLLLMVAAYDAAAYDARVRETTNAMMTHNIAGLSRHIVAGQVAGFVDTAVDPAEAAAWLMWMAERGFHRLLAEAEGSEWDRLLDGYVAIVWNSLYAGAACRTATHSPR
jgi:AcrR family transcriptional regulator